MRALGAGHSVSSPSAPARCSARPRPTPCHPWFAPRPVGAIRCGSVGPVVGSCCARTRLLIPVRRPDESDPVAPASGGSSFLAPCIRPRDPTRSAGSTTWVSRRLRLVPPATPAVRHSSARQRSRPRHPQPRGTPSGSTARLASERCVSVQVRPGADPEPGVPGRPRGPGRGVPSGRVRARPAGRRSRRPRAGVRRGGLHSQSVVPWGKVCALRGAFRSDSRPTGPIQLVGPLSVRPGPTRPGPDRSDSASSGGDEGRARGPPALRWLSGRGAGRWSGWRRPGARSRVRRSGVDRVTDS